MVDRALPKKRFRYLPHSVMFEAMILNDLWFHRPVIVLFPNFFIEVPTEKLFGNGIYSLYLNNDIIGITLDATRISEDAKIRKLLIL